MKTKVMLQGILISYVTKNQSLLLIESYVMTNEEENPIIYD
jgi:hypothetical protein